MISILMNYSKNANAQNLTTKTRDAVIIAKSVALNKGDIFEPLKDVKAMDDAGKGKDITRYITTKGSVDTNKVGQYKYTYSVKGANGNLVSKQITVTVKEPKQAKDAIILAKDSSIKLGETFDPLKNVKATDAGGRGKDITNSVTVKGTVNINKAGQYKLTYSVRGENGKIVSKQITVTVQDTITVQDTNKSCKIVSTDSNIIEVITLTNAERAKKNLSTLCENTELSRIAKIKAQDMAHNNYLDHYSDKYGWPGEMLIYFGMKYSSVGENIAKGQTTPEQVMKDWMDSQAHRDNILKSVYTEIGIGYVYDKNGDIIWVQLYRTPK